MGIPWLKLGELGAGTFGNLYASRKQSTANREALAYQQQANEQAMAMDREMEAERKRQFDVQQVELKRQWDATQQFEASRFAASEDERLYDRRIRDERETRRAPYRAASEAALARLPGILAGGRMSPGMGSLGSFRKG